MGRRPANGREALGELERYLERAGRRRLGLDELERESVTKVGEIGGRSLQAHIDTRGVGDVGPALVLRSPESGCASPTSGCTPGAS